MCGWPGSTKWSGRKHYRVNFHPRMFHRADELGAEATKGLFQPDAGEALLEFRHLATGVN